MVEEGGRREAEKEGVEGGKEKRGREGEGGGEGGEDMRMVWDGG